MTTRKFKHIYVKDIPESYTLISNSQDIRATLETIGMLSELEDVGCLFVTTENGEYTDVLACGSAVPYKNKIVWGLL